MGGKGQIYGAGACLNRRLRFDKSTSLPIHEDQDSVFCSPEMPRKTGDDAEAAMAADFRVKRQMSAREFDTGNLDDLPIFNRRTGSFILESPSIPPKPEMSQPPTPDSVPEETHHCDFTTLIKDIANELNHKPLYHKILVNLCRLTKADTTSLYIIEGAESIPDYLDHAGDKPDEKYLVNVLFNVREDSQYCEDELNSPLKVVKLGVGVVGTVAKTGKLMNIPDVNKEPLFNPAVDMKTGYKTRSILCVPIVTPELEVIGVAQGINKGGQAHPKPFNSHDVDTFQSYLAFAGIALANARLFNQSRMETKRSRILLELAKAVFEEQSTVQTLAGRIMRKLVEFYNCRLCCVAVAHANHPSPNPATLTAKSFLASAWKFRLDNGDGERMETPDDNNNSSHEIEELFPADLLEKCLNEDKLVNVRFVEGSGRDCGNVTVKSILLSSIRNSSGAVVGAVQLVNKTDVSSGRICSFSRSDEHFLEAFNIFGGLGITNTMLYEQTKKAEKQQKVELEILSYHTSASEPEQRALIRASRQQMRKVGISGTSRQPIVDKIVRFGWNDLELSEHDTLSTSFTMFNKLGLLNRFHVDERVLANWLITTKKNYRQVTYHNWRHAYSVTQIMFACLQTGQLAELLDQSTILALLVATLSHDLDHRGTTNDFHKKSFSPLAQLYSTSPLERHHFQRFKSICSMPGCDILGNLAEESRQAIVDKVEHLILATDLAREAANRTNFCSRVAQGKFDPGDPSDLHLLTSILMTACDLGSMTRPWHEHQQIVNLLAEEFFAEGDMEKSVFHKTPPAMFDREQQFQLPKLQVGFIDGLCVPMYKALADAFPTLHPMLDGVLANRDNWQRLCDSS